METRQDEFGFTKSITMTYSRNQVEALLRELRVNSESQCSSTYAREHFERYEKTIKYIKKFVEGSHIRILDLATSPIFCFLLSKEVRAVFYGTSPLAPKFPAGYDENLTTSSQTVEYQNERLEYAVVNNLNLEISNLPFNDQFFDIVCCNDIIEHLIYSPTKMLCEIHRVLKPKGFLCMTTDNANNLLKLCRILLNKPMYFHLFQNSVYYRHNREYLKHELEDLLNGIGFCIMSSRYFNYNPFRYRKYLFYRIAYDVLYLLSYFPLLRKRKKHIFILAQPGEKNSRYYPSWLYR